MVVVVVQSVGGLEVITAVLAEGVTVSKTPIFPVAAERRREFISFSRGLGR